MASSAGHDRVKLARSEESARVRSMGDHQKLLRSARNTHCGNPPKPDRETAEKAAERERKFLYGKWDPSNGVCPVCFILMPATGECGECAA